MPVDRDPASILDIVLAARRILEFTRGLEGPAFLADVKTQSAVIHQFLIIGEAAKRISQECRLAHPGIPWQPIAKMRDKLIHHYEAADPRELWRTVERDVPALLAALDEFLPKGGPEA